jgi:hypothetical protein
VQDHVCDERHRHRRWQVQRRESAGAAEHGDRQCGTHWKLRFFVPSTLVTMRVEDVWPDRPQYASADSIAANNCLSERYA